ncbi:uncharacterized protein DEA37_0000305, partial [Paragonimus westermani]
MCIYRILRDAFDFLVSARGVTDQSGGRRLQSVFREQMKNLELDFHGNGSHLYVPCGLGLFKHLFDVTNEVQGFPGPSYRFEITYYVACINAGSEKFIEMAKMNDFNQDLTFNDRRVKTENIYRTPECDLYFEVVHHHDMDIYYCYLRDPTKPNGIWSRLPEIAYQLQMEKATFKWPRENNGHVGIAVLTAWSLFLSSFWVLLSLYDSVTHKHALFWTTVKEVGGRMARLRKVYSSFLDENRGLFFKIMQNEVQRPK